MWKYNEIYTNICGNTVWAYLFLWIIFEIAKLNLTKFFQVYIVRDDALSYYLIKFGSHCCAQCGNMNKTVKNLLTGRP